MTTLTSLLSEGIVRFRAVGDLSNAAGAVVIVVLICLLVCREMARATDMPRRAEVMRLLDVGILPMLTGAGVALVLRLWYLL